MFYIFAAILLIIALLSGHAAIALLLGISLTYVPNFPSNFFTKKIGSKLLQTGIVFLGGSISLPTVVELNSTYLPWISLFVVTTFLAVIFLGKLLGVEKKQAYLLASGTAICGGTAMAAVAPSIKAKPEDLTTTLSIVFLLNAIAVIAFPLIGDWFNLNQEQFGIWAALAIHDTASVIGAASVVGFDAVEVAATLKLARTLWIVPLVFFSALYFKSENQGSVFPVFIIFFVLAVVLNTTLNPSEDVLYFLRMINKTFLLAGLFCIGTQIDKDSLKNITIKPLLLALGIWFTVIPVSLWAVMST
tara:strand:- start:489 stop:1397 length:909 start_codon:yes stop_codon:yes gene_type:complete